MRKKADLYPPFLLFFSGITVLIYEKIYGIIQKDFLKGGKALLKEFMGAALAALQICTAGMTSSPVETEYEPLPDHTYIVHAAGVYEGFKKTNSLEALENAYRNGNRYIELDFNFTSDLRPVCIHDWNHLAFSGYDGVKPTEDEFMQNGVYSLFSSINLEVLADFLTRHTDAYIITDVKDLNVYFAGVISREYPHLSDRFIIQAYSENEYFHIKKLGFENIIFSLYKLDWETKTDTEYLTAFAKNNRLFGYTFPAELCDLDGYVEGMLKADTPLFVHTVNDKTEQKKFFDMGIAGIYTDNVIHT